MTALSSFDKTNDWKTVRDSMYKLYLEAYKEEFIGEKVTVNSISGDSTKSSDIYGASSQQLSEQIAMDSIWFGTSTLVNEYLDKLQKQYAKEWFENTNINSQLTTTGEAKIRKETSDSNSAATAVLLAKKDSYATEIYLKKIYSTLQNKQTWGDKNSLQDQLDANFITGYYSGEYQSLKQK
jgi:hypothetical protein